MDNSSSLLSFRYTVNLDSSSSDDDDDDDQRGTPTLAKLGGKALNLIKLVRADGFTVPPGFVVTVDAYTDFVNRNSLHEHIRNALSSALANTEHDEDIDDHRVLLDPSILESVSETIRDAFRRGRKSLSDDFVHEIDLRMAQLRAPAVAVRSSATTEDLPDTSFAGQQDTYLNVIYDPSTATTDAVQTAIIDCFASLYTARAIAYRQRNGISQVDGVKMAVVVQSMVNDPECSGVLFTANPLTGRRDESVLEIVPGLGEALVSGVSDPDRYRIATASGEIMEKHVGSKKVSIRPKIGSSGVRYVEEEEGEEESSSGKKTMVGDDVVQELMLIGRKTQDLFGYIPQDIEWARCRRGEIHILQSRPITTLFPLPENVSAADDDHLQVMFSFGAIQGIAGPITPAGQDTIRLVLGGASSIFYGKRGIEERRKRVFLVAAERLFINATPAVRNSAGRRFLHRGLTIIEPGIDSGLKQIEDDPRLAETGGLSPRFFLRIVSLVPVLLPRYLYSLLCPEQARKRLFSRLDKLVSEVQKCCDEARSLQEVLNIQEECIQQLLPSMITHFVPRMGAAMGPFFLLRHLAQVIPDGRDLALMLTRGLPYNVTTEMDLNLWEVAQRIRRGTESYECFQKLNAEKLASAYLAKKLPERAQRTIEEFMTKYGMRGLAEIDFGRPRWREDPLSLMQTLKSYMDIKEDRAPDRVFAAGAKAAADAASRLSQELGMPRLVAFLVRRVRSLAGVRELPKFTAIRCMGIFRERMLREGERLVDTKVLTSPNDIFMLHSDELKALAAGESRDWKVIVATRRSRLDYESRRKRVPQLLASDGFAYYGGASPSRTTPDDEDLHGEPVSPGTAEGRVRVVLDPTQTKLSPGEILVCPGTDPSWTPLFLSAAALVMEVGGLMTHGSVVAREYGIPAVVGVEHVTEKLETGQSIVVNGSTGVIKIIVESIGEKKAAAPPA